MKHKNWDNLKVKQLSKYVTAGGTPSTQNPKFWGGDIPWMNSGEINLKKIDSVSGRITQEGLKKSSTKIIPPYSVLIALAGQGKTRGTVAINKIKLCTNQSLGAIITNERILPYYLYYNLDFRYSELRKYSTGEGGRGGLNLQIINNIEVFFPKNRKTQRKIVEILSSWDQAIETTDKLISAKEKQFKWLLKKLITDQKNNPKWKKTRLEEIGLISSSGVDKKIIKGEKPIKLINYLDVLNKNFIYSSDLTHWVTASSDKIDKCSVKKGDVFFTPSSEIQGDIAHSAVSIEDIEQAVYSYHIVRFRLKTNWDIRFRGYIFKSEYFYKQAYSFCQGSGQRYVISQNNFKKMEVCFPKNRNLQKRIADILYAKEQEIKILEKISNKYKEQKKGLMQKLLTGRIRLY